MAAGAAKPKDALGRKPTVSLLFIAAGRPQIVSFPLMLKTIFCSLLGLMATLPGWSQTETAAPKPPKRPPRRRCRTRRASRFRPGSCFPGLFEAVQLGRIFPDNKTFVDAAPRQRPATILAAWRREKAQPGFHLKAFVESHFTMPAERGSALQSDVKAGLRHHLDTLWTVLARPAAPAADAADSLAQFRSLVPLPKPYLVPGGRFREVYYWDSYFTMLGLAEAGKAQLLKDITDNFAYLIGRFGFIPNGNRTYYLTRSQPPFFANMVQLLAQERGNGELLRYRPALEAEYRYWMRGGRNPEARHRRPPRGAPAHRRRAEPLLGRERPAPRRILRRGRGRRQEAASSRPRSSTATCGRPRPRAGTSAAAGSGPAAGWAPSKPPIWCPST